MLTSRERVCKNCTMFEVICFANFAYDIKSCIAINIFGGANVSVLLGLYTIEDYQANFISHHTRDRHVGFRLAWHGIGKHNKMSRYSLFSSYRNSKLQQSDKNITNTLGGNFKSFCEANQKFKRHLLFFSIPRHTKRIPSGAAVQNRARLGAHRVVQYLYLDMWYQRLCLSVVLIFSKRGFDGLFIIYICSSNKLKLNVYKLTYLKKNEVIRRRVVTNWSFGCIKASLMI